MTLARAVIVDIDRIENDRYKITLHKEHEPERMVSLTREELDVINTTIKEGTFN